MKLEDKIYLLGLLLLDELLLHRNVSKKTEVFIEDASILSDILIHINSPIAITLNESEITEFYRDIWSKGIVFPRHKLGR